MVVKQLHEAGGAISMFKHDVSPVAGSRPYYLCVYQRFLRK